ncbi:MAG: hypothetical protein SNJ70_06395 [Armatimonadota bacterium]
MTKNRLILIVMIVALGTASYLTSKHVLAQNYIQKEVAPEFLILQNHLQLTDSQRKAMAKIDSEFAQRRPELRQKIVSARLKLLAVLEDENSTVQDAQAAITVLNNAQHEMHLDTITYTILLRDKLESKQKQQLIATMTRGMCADYCSMGRNQGKGKQGIPGMLHCGGRRNQ